jgi:1,4-dihydroxy-2-naphthoyl-CoA synthase
MDWITAKITKISLIKNGLLELLLTVDVRNAFRPKQLLNCSNAFYDAQEDTSIGLFYFLLKGCLKDGVYSFLQR